MDILAINGSPRKNGVTNLMLEHFMKGAAEAGATTELIQLADEKIHHCTGEFHCWFQKPGVCLWDGRQGDTMARIREIFSRADKVVFGTPIYVDGMTGLMKTMFDRFLPNVHPHIELDKNGDIRHPLRVGRPGKKMVLVSCSGFPEPETFSALVKHFERIVKNMRADLAGRLLRPSGGALHTPGRISEETRNAVLAAIVRAGKEFVEQGRVSPETEKAVSVNYMPVDKKLFAQGFNAMVESAFKAAAAS
jgi:multimeric flavodoxin WrbA